MKLSLISLLHVTLFATSVNLLKSISKTHVNSTCRKSDVKVMDQRVKQARNYDNKSRPNIVFILVDDVGWNDVSWHNSDVIMPNLNKLANQGVILNSSYVAPLCSPSRAALLTGVYPFRLGLQHGVLKRTKPHGLPLNVTILPQHLKALGYATHMIGKWHLGFCNWSYTPTRRGFDSFFGFYTGQQDYYTHRTTGTERGYDFRYNANVFKSITSRYSTTTYGKHAADVIMNHNRKLPLLLYMAFQAAHTPLQVPSKYESLYPEIKNPKRRKFVAMVTAMDDAIGDIIKALTRRNIINNTLIVFLSDNGASPYGAGNNWPLRGGKSTLWEGGTRVPCFVWGHMLNKTGYTHDGLMHVVDWLPTLLAAARGDNVNDPDNDLNAIDGLRQWNMLRYGQPSNRTEFIYNINSVSGQAAIRSGPYKLIEGVPGHYSNWFTPSTQRADDIRILKQNNKRSVLSRHVNQTLMFNIETDRVESNDLTDQYPDVVAHLRHKLNAYRKLETVPLNPRRVRDGLPKYWDGVWSPGWC